MRANISISFFQSLLPACSCVLWFDESLSSDDESASQTSASLFFQFISCICFNSCSRIHLHRISTFQMFILWYSIAFIAGFFCLTRFIKVYSSFNFLFNWGTWLIIVLLRCFVLLLRIWFTKFQVITVLVFIIITVFFIKFGSCARQWCCNCSTKLRIFRCIYNRFLKKRQNTDLYDAVNNLSIITKH